MEFENFRLVKARTRRSTPVVIRSSTWAFTFSTPASANTTGVVSEGVAARLASSSTVTLLTGANVSATRVRDRRVLHGDSRTGGVSASTGIRKTQKKATAAVRSDRRRSLI